MSDSINLLNSLSGLGSLSSISGLTGSSSCTCSESSSSSTGAFDIVLTSLLKAINEKNKLATTEEEKISLESLLNSYNNNISTGDILYDNIPVDERIENAVQLYSNKYGVDSDLVKAIIKVESNYDPNVVSSAGAQGLMQLMPENCTALGVTDPLNIEQNIEGGVKHIKEYIDRYNGDIEMALMAYNGGPTRMANRGVNSIDDIYKMPKETQNYVPKVMSYYRGYANGN